MNKILVAITTFLLTIMFANAQTEKGTQTAGLTFQYSTLQSSNFSIDQSTYAAISSHAKTTIFNFGPQYSYFIGNQLDLAFNVSYSSSVTNLQNNDPNVIEPTKQSSKELDARVAIRKYLLYQNKLGVRVGAYLAYGHEQEAYIYPSPNESSSNTTNYPSAGLNLELVYYPLKKLGFSAILANLQYQQFRQSSVPDVYSNGSSFNFALTNGLAISAFYVFGGKG
jgi:hypothetical protein